MTVADPSPKLSKLLAALTILKLALVSAVHGLGLSSPPTASGDAVNTGYLIDSDPSGTLDRSAVTVSVGLSWEDGESGDYRIVFSIVDAEGNSFGSSSQVVSGAPGTSVNYSAPVPANSRLDPFAVYFAKIAVVSDESGTEVLARTATVAHRFLHFDSLVSTDAPYNVIAEIINASFDRKFIIDTVANLDTATVDVSFRLHRYDNWLIPLNPGAATVAVTLDYQLFERATGQSVPLVQSSTTTNVVVAEHGVNNFFVPPAVVSSGAVLEIDPVGQLDPVNEEYYLEVQISHVDQPGQAAVVGNTMQSSTAEKILHFNGTLLFGEVATTFTSITSGHVPPDLGSAPGPAVSTSLRVDAQSGQVNGFPSHTYGDGSLLSVHLLADGDARLAAGSTPLNNPPGDTDTVAGVGVERLAPMSLTTAGPIGSLLVTLPAGFGFSTSLSSCVLESEITFPTILFNQSLHPAAESLAGGPSPGYYVEETKPVRLKCGPLTWRPSQGSFTLDVTDTVWVRRQQFDQLQVFRATGKLDNSHLATKRSNEAYFNHVRPDGTVVITASGGVQNSAEITGRLKFGDGDFISHFPYNVGIDFDSGGMTIDGDQVVPSASVLDGVAQIQLDYVQSCPPPEDCSPNATSELVLFDPDDGDLHFTPDGGLQGQGTTSMQAGLRWGYIDAMARYVHDFDQQFVTGNFLMSGHFVSGEANPASADNGPGVVHLSGFQPGDLTQTERPTRPAYQDGFADYAGINFRCVNDGDFTSTSTLAGSVFPGIVLKGSCKYYIRESGVSGIFDPTDTGFPEMVLLWGYDFTIDNFGLNYLSNENIDSLTEGAIDLPYPSNFVQDFEELRFTCLGNLQDAKVPADDPTKELDYWDAAFDTLAIDFVANVACDPSQGGSLLLGIQTFASHVEAPLFGNLGVRPNGQLIRPSDALGGIESRFKLPNNMVVNGPEGQAGYVFSPTEDAYFNHEPNAPAGPGFWNLIGAWEVPYFRDLQVHLHTRATQGDTASGLFVMGGWPGGQGWEPEGQDPSKDLLFDENHDGFPTGSGLDRYRRVGAHLPINAPGDEQFLVRAQQEFLDVVYLDYTLKWSSTLRSFESSKPTQNDLLVINVEHVIGYLSASHVDLSFGIQYGLPNISLANLAFNAIDASTGVLDSFTDSVGGELLGFVNEGLGDMSELLADQADALLEEVIEDVAGTAVDQLVGGLALDRVSGNSLEVAEINGRLAVFCTTLKGDLNQLTFSDANNPLIGEIDSRLAAVEAAIEAVIGEVSMDLNGTPIPSQRFLKKGSSGRRDKVRALVLGLVDDLASEYLGAFVDEILDPLFEQAEPTFAQIVVVLQGVKDSIGEVRDQLANSTDFASELSAIAFANTSKLKLAVDLACADIGVSLTSANNLTWNFDDFSQAEWRAQMRQVVRDRILAADYVADVQEAIKERAYDLDALMREALDTSFAAVRRIIREVIAESLAELDRNFTGALQDLASVIGAAQIDGYAHINGDSLKELRLDGLFQWQVPDELEFGAYLRILQLDSDSDGSCAVPVGDPATEVTLGATQVPLDWLGQDATCDVGTKFVFQGGGLRGMGGSFEVNGDIRFETFVITEFGAAVMFGADENYVAAKAGIEFDSISASGGIFFGKTCSSQPLILVDPDFEGLLGAPNPSFSGAYVYAEAWVPVFGGSCFFNISAGAGVGVFYFTEGPTYGGKMLLGVSGEAICLVSVKGQVKMIGVKKGDDFRFKGKGKISGSVGPCPFCVKFSVSQTVRYSTSGGYK